MTAFIRHRAVLGAVAVLALAACTTVTETGRTQLNFISDSELQLAASAQFQQMKEQVPLSTNAAYKEQVERVGRRIAAVVQEQMTDAQWEFVVFDDPQVNAFAMPGGKVGVYTGLLKLVDSDDELATVMGHEVAHVSASHGGERVSQATAAQGVGVLLGYAVKERSELTRQAVATAYGLGVQVGALLPYSRLQESEADEIGLTYAARAGYDPRASITFWEKMAAQSRESGSPPQFLSTHPNPDNRIAKLHELMPDALQVYADATRSGVPSL